MPTDRTLGGQGEASSGHPPPRALPTCSGLCGCSLPQQGPEGQPDGQAPLCPTFHSFSSQPQEVLHPDHPARSQLQHYPPHCAHPGPSPPLRRLPCEDRRPRCPLGSSDSQPEGPMLTPDRSSTGGWLAFQSLLSLRVKGGHSSPSIFTPRGLTGAAYGVCHRGLGQFQEITHSFSIPTALSLPVPCG